MSSRVIQLGQSPSGYGISGYSSGTYGVGDDLPNLDTLGSAVGTVALTVTALPAGVTAGSAVGTVAPTVTALP